MENLEYSRITAKIVLEPTEKPQEAILTAFLELVKELQQADESITVIPWKISLFEKALSNKSEMPDTITKVSKYFF